MKTKTCPICGGAIRIYSDHEIGDEVYCDECEREFRLLAISPVYMEPIEVFDDYCFEEDEY